MKPSHRFFHVVSGILVLTGLIFSCDRNNSPTGENDTTITGIVKGRITYQGGTDFSGITVTLEKVTDGETAKIIVVKTAITVGEDVGKIALDSSAIMTTVTDTNGDYQFINVPPGDYSLTAQKTANHLAKVANIAVTAEGPTIVDVVLTATANIVGTVLLEGMDDYSGVLIYLAGTSYMAMTDSKGKYTISDVPLGSYQLTTSAYEYDMAKTAVTLESAGASEEVAVITLRKTGVIMGRVVDAVSGSAMNNVIVKALTGHADTTSADGVFRLDNVPAGSALLSLALSGYDVRWVEVSPIKSGELTTLPDAVKMYKQGTTPPDEEEQFKGYHTISGTITTTDGEPLSFVTVSILKSDGTPTNVSTIADVNGHYFIPALTYGSVKLCFDAGEIADVWRTDSEVIFEVLIYDDDNIFDVQADDWGWLYPERNNPPIADAGEDQHAKISPAPVIILEGNGFDPDGYITNYEWKQIEGPVVSLSNMLVSTLIFSPPATGSYGFELVVTDNKGWKSLPDRVTVTITTVSYDDLGITLVSIPAGSFQMGDLNNAGSSDEKPIHTVILNSFYMSATEITQYQYEALTGKNPSEIEGNTNLPVETVSWYDAIVYCNLLSDLTGLTRCYNETTLECNFNANGFRLPTEAEWEYACRAGTTTRYYTGDTENDLKNAGWYYSNSTSTTHLVGGKISNAWGLYDMHGNVCEWCNDWYGNYASEQVTNPIGPITGSARVQRGGGWSFSADQCRTANRDYLEPVSRSWGFGFRVVSRTMFN